MDKNSGRLNAIKEIVIDISNKAKFGLWEKELRAAKTTTAVFCAWQPKSDSAD